MTKTEIEIYQSACLEGMLGGKTVEQTHAMAWGRINAHREEEAKKAAAK